MATDRTTEYEGSCKCGSGLFRIDYCTPSHGWPTSTPYWYEAHIDCSNCAKKYDLIQQDQVFILVEQSETRECEHLRNEAQSLATKLMESPEVQNLLAKFIDFLEDEPSMAAVHRLLKKAGLEYYSVGTFRKHWLDAKNWVERNISDRQLPEVMAILSHHDKTISERIQRIEALREQADKPLTPIGDIVYRISRYI